MGERVFSHSGQSHFVTFCVTIAVGYLSRTQADKSSSQPLTTRHAKAPQQSI